MKQLLFAILLIVGCAHADELPLDHSFGPTLSSQALAFSPSGKKLAVAGSDGVKVYKPTTGRVLETFAGSRWKTNSVAWSPDGKALAVGGQTQTSANAGEIWIWREGRKALHWTTGKAVIQSLAWSPDGHILASAGGTDIRGDGNGGSACLWDATSGKLKRTLGNYPLSDAAIAFSNDGNAVAFSYSKIRSEGEGHTTLVDVRSGRVLKTWDKVGTPLVLDNQTPLFGPNILARALRNGYEWRLEETFGEKIRTFFSARKIGAKVEATRMELGSGGMGAAFGGDYLAAEVVKRGNEELSSSVFIWKISGNPPRAVLVRTLGGRTVSAAQLAVSGDGKTLGLVGAGGTALFDSNFSHLRFLPFRDSKKPLSMEHSRLSLSWDGKRIYDGRWLNLASPKTREVLPTREVFNEWPYECAISPNGEILAGAFQGKAELRFSKGLQFKRILALPDSDEFQEGLLRYCRFAWAPNGKHLSVVGSRDTTGQLFLFDANGKYEKQQLMRDFSTRWISSAFAPDGQRLAGLGVSDGGVVLNLWNAATRKLEKRVVVRQKNFGPTGQPGFVAFSPDSHTVGAWSMGGEGPGLVLFDAKSGDRVGDIISSPFGDESWVFLDSRRVAVLNGNAIDVWDFRAHKKEKSVFMVPKTNSFEFVERS